MKVINDRLGAKRWNEVQAKLSIDPTLVGPSVFQYPLSHSF
jgi:hypothetical protein